MAITWDEDRRAWVFDDVTEVEPGHFNNLLNYGQPYSPYETDLFRHDLYDGPDSIESPTVIFNNQDVISNGFGQNIELTDFDVVKNLSEGSVDIPDGIYNLTQLQNRGLSAPGTFGDHAMGTNLYINQDSVGVSSNLGVATAAYVFGSIRFQISQDSEFVFRDGKLVSVDGRIELQTDNFNHESTTLPDWVSALVAVGAGDAVNFEEVIMLYEGKGSERSVSKIIPENEFCFSAGTQISMANGSQKPIQDIVVGEKILSFDADGNLVAAIVDKLFSNTTDALIRLSFDDGRDDLLATPGHHFLTETGYYLEIGQMEQLGSGTVRLVDKDGSVVTATAERIAYSTETASMFEEAQTQTIAYAGNTILKEESPQGWKTYNFEVAETHTYIAGGIRVHNRSVLDFLEDHELQNLQDLRDTNDDGKYDFAVVDIDNGNVEYDVSMRTVSGDSIQVIREMTAYDKNGDLYYKRFIKDANGNVIRVVNSDLEGQQLGEDVGKALTPIFAQSFIDADSSVFERVAANTVIDTLLGNLGEVMGGYAHRLAVDQGSFSVFEQLDTISDGAFLDLGGDFVVAGIDSSISVINQLIVSEIFEGLELDGIDGAIFEGLTSYGINEVLRGAAGNLIATDAFQDILTTSGFSDASIDTINRAFAGDAFDNFTPANISNIIFSAVFHEIVPPIETLEGQAASVITSALVNFFNVAGQFGGPVGVVLGYVVGKFFDDLFGDDPEPRAFAHIGFDEQTGHFKILDSYSADGGDEGLARDLAQIYVDGINGFVDTIMANSHNYDEIGQWSIGHFRDSLKNAGKNGKTFEDFRELYINSYVNTVADSRHNDGQMTAVRALNKLNVSKMIDSTETIYHYALSLADIRESASNSYRAAVVDARDDLEELISANIVPRPGRVWDARWMAAKEIFDDFLSVGRNTTRADFKEHLKEGYGSEVYTEEEIFENIGMALTVADDYHRYLENQNEIDTMIAMNPDSAFAAGWLTTLLQAREMGLGNRYNLTGDSIGNNFFTADGNDVVRGMGGNDDIRTYGGNDSIEGGAGEDRIKAGNGNDTIRGGDGSDLILGGNGNDKIYAGDGNDTIRAGDDNDRLNGEKGADSLDGGAGIDEAGYQHAASGVTADLQYAGNNTGEARGDSYRSIENLSGSRHADKLFGDTGHNVIWGNDGNDVLRGRDGNDSLHGGNGNDSLYGGNGRDALNGNDGADRLEGGAHGDILRGGNHDDELYGQDGNDSLGGDDGDDTLYGGNDNDSLYGGLGHDVLRGEAGNDTIWAHSGNDTLEGNNGADVLYASSGNDLLLGGAQNDDLRGETGKDTLSGGLGNDTLYGGDHDDELFGNAGTDDLRGGSGNDTLEGGGGADRLHGEAGIDQVSYSQSLSGVTADLQYSGNNAGDAAGDTFISIENIYGSEYGDRLRGDAAANTMWGAAGNDNLDGRDGDDAIYAGSGNDILIGGAGNDRLHGSDGNDRIRGDAGNDTLNGGAGNDVFIFTEGGDRDRIKGFENNLDTIELRGLGISNFSQARGFATQSNDDVIFDFGNGDRLTVENTTINALQDDMIFN